MANDHIKLRMWGQLKQLAGADRAALPARPGMTVETLFMTVSSEHAKEVRDVLLSPEGGVNRSLLITVNSQPVRNPAAHELSAGDEVTVMSPIAGG